MLQFNKKETLQTKLKYSTIKNNKINGKNALYPCIIFETILQGEGRVT